jgi:predicted nucleic acid-binding protein
MPVLLDIFNDDERFSEWSIQTLNDTQKNHDLVIKAIIFSAISLNFDSYEALIHVLTQLDIEILDIPLPAAFHVSRVFKQYKQNKGDKKSPMSDFYIGAHANYLQVPIITRDMARFNTYYPDVALITPTQ